MGLVDGKGKYHLNPQRAKGADKFAASQPPKMAEKGPKMDKPAPNEGGGDDIRSEVRNHLEDMAMRHGGTHMYIHGDGVEHTSHHVGEDGEVQGPHVHPDVEALANHVHQVFGSGEDPMAMAGGGGSPHMSGEGMEGI